MEQFGRTKYARQLLRKQPCGERRQSDDPEELEGGPGARQAASAEAQRASAASSLHNRKGRGLSAGSSSDDSDDNHEPSPRNEVSSSQQVLSPHEDEDEEEEEEEDSEDDDEDEDEPSVAIEGTYDPADYANLPVSTEIKDLFQYITRYSPKCVELDHSLKPFIPDFIPAVGDIDAFLKVPRPDGAPDNLGLLVLDEPSVKQSDPTVMSLWLSEESKQHTVTKLQKVTSVASPHTNPRQVDSWVESIGALHRSKPPASVLYSRAMPTIDSLMQEWPPEVEELLAALQLPSARLGCSLAQYADLTCCLLDVPVYGSRIQALHLLFTLFLESRDLQHFTHGLERSPERIPSQP
ncbi:intraflagellar transport protein 46 homolog [Takifugu flavidus]|nr:intraflagellar transport protein 46 homolog [Takifugu flavidus]